MTSLTENNLPQVDNPPKVHLRPKEVIEEKEDLTAIMKKLREQDKITITKDKSMGLKEFADSLGLNVRMLDFDFHRSSSIHSHVYFFTIELERAAREKGTLKWTLRKKVSDFLELQKSLNEELKKKAKLSKDKIPQLQAMFDFTHHPKPEDFLNAAQNYLQKLLDTPEVRSNSTKFYEFIEFSLLPLPNGPYKYKEGYLKKRGGGRFKKNKLRLYFSALFRRWQKRWFILTEEGIIYTVDSGSTRVREMLLFDQSFEMEYGQRATGSREGINLVVPNRKLNLKAKDQFEALIWISEIKKASEACHYTKKNRYDSFAPLRDDNNYCKWYVDAEGYYEDLYEMLLHAKKEVFITDWWLTPELPLRRPVEDGDSEYRIDKVLAKIANAGVRVYIIVYNEVKLLMYNASDHTKEALEGLSPNITVLQHPSEPFFSWSHHEKMVVIDQAIGFIGGFDLCFGRFDVSSHPLVDPAYVEEKGQMFVGKDYANPRIIDFKDVIEHDKPLIDKKTTPRLPWHDAMLKVSGPVVQDLSRHFIQYWNHVEVDVYRKAREAPLPKNNITTGTTEDVTGLRMENSTIRFRNALKKIFTSKVMMPNKNHEIQVPESAGKKKPSDESRSTLASLRNADEIQKTPQGKKQSKDDNDKHDSMTSLDDNLKRDGGSSAKKSEPKKSEEEEKRESNAPKNFLHSLKEKVKLLIPYKLRERFKLKNVTKLFGYPSGGKVLPIAGTMPTKKEYQKARMTSWFSGICGRRKRQTQDSDSESSDDDDNQQQVVNKVSKRIRVFTNKQHHGEFTQEQKTKLTQKRIERLLFSQPEKLLEGTCSVQMLRSSAKWSMGLNKDTDDGENSIENAYVDMIKNAKNFIYIENQFFMSATAGKVLKNRVGEELVQRVIKAHERKEKFRILIFLPLVHAFEGDITDSKAAVIRIQMYWQYVTISRGESSIYESLKSKGIVPEDYIQFYGLRTHARMPNGEPVTEQIYIHSKILITDDDLLLIGSANINDRSLLGSRDSEIAVVVKDHKKMETVMNGEKREVSEVVATLRRRLLAEHLGMKEEEVVDPLNDEFMKKMQRMMKRNTEIYREVFMCYPDDNMRTIQDVVDSAEKKNLEKYDELKGEIKGHVVDFPLKFLEEEKLVAQISSMEYYIPDETYV